MFALALLLFQQDNVTFRSPRGTFELVNFQRALLDIQGLHATASGQPFTLRWRDRGIELTGRTGTVDAAQGGPEEYILTRANLAGGLVLTQDTQAADQFLNRTSVNHSQMRLATDAFSYAGDATQGSLNIPAAFDLTSQVHREGPIARKSKSTKQDEKVDQVGDTAITAHGSSGTITFAVQPKDINSLRTGTIMGPITAHIDRHTVTGGVADPPTIIDGAADRMDIDFTGPQHTMTLTGNVSITGTSEAYSGDTHAAKAVITFGPDGRVLSIEMTGSPTTTTVKPRGSGGRSSTQRNGEAEFFQADHGTRRQGRTLSAPLLLRVENRRGQE